MKIKEITIKRCPKCMKFSFSTDWIEGEVSCEDCGSHDAEKCPECQKMIDIVYNDIEEIDIDYLLRFYNSTKEKIVEELAELEHNQWAHWTKYMLGHLSRKIQVSYFVIFAVIGKNYQKVKCH